MVTRSSGNGWRNNDERDEDCNRLHYNGMERGTERNGYPIAAEAFDLEICQLTRTVAASGALHQS